VREEPKLAAEHRATTQAKRWDGLLYVAMQQDIMATVSFRDQEIECEEGAVLRNVLLNAGLSPHNGSADTLNCSGHGTCGTCAVEVEGPVSEPGQREQVRLSVPPHTADSGLRLACQTRVKGDLTVKKYPGFFGQNIDRGPL
jgi:ferredoxin